MTRQTGIQLALPPGSPVLLPAPPTGMACVGVDQGSVIFAGPRPDGRWPSPAGWLPGLLGGPGTAGVDDSGWRMLMRGLVDVRVTPGTVYGRGVYVGQVAGDGLYLDLAWLEDVFPDRMIHVDPAYWIDGLTPAIPAVPLSQESQKVPALVSNADGSVVQPGSVTVVTREGLSALLTGNGAVVQVGQLDVSVGLEFGGGFR